MSGIVSENAIANAVEIVEYEFSEMPKRLGSLLTNRMIGLTEGSDKINPHFEFEYAARFYLLMLAKHFLRKKICAEQK